MKTSRCEPRILKLAPQAVIKPWGLIHREALSLTSVRVGVGELWLASAQTGEGNYSNVVCEPPYGMTLARLLEEAAEGGDSTLGLLLGEGALAALKANPHRGKTEAWHVRATKGRTGFVSGPRTAEELAELKKVIAGGGLDADVERWPEEVRALMGIIEPLSAGEVYTVPCGTLHTMFALGAESWLVIDELQQGYGQSRLPTLSKVLMVQDSLESLQVHPCDETVAAAASGEIKLDQNLELNPTVRVSDFGRGRQQHPELGFRLTDVGAGLRRVPTVEVHPQQTVSVRLLVADSHLVKSQIRLEGAARWRLRPAYGSYRVLHCWRGVATLSAAGSCTQLKAGETAFVPGALEEELHIESAHGCELFDDAFPQLEALRAFLAENGASAEQIERLLNPPRAV